MKKLFSIIVLLLALVFASQALAAKVYWSTTTAEDAVYASSWANQHNIVDVTCSGVGRPLFDTSGEPTFSKFLCAAEYDTTFYGDAFTCQLTISVRPISATRFGLAGGDNSNCLPVQGYVPGN